MSTRGDILERPSISVPSHEPAGTDRFYLPPGAAALLALHAKACRWPIGLPAEEAFRFCGAAIAGRSSYCADHAALSRGEGGQ